jgi:hypothetical protein
MSLVLHGFRYSVYVRVARIALAEKGLAYEHVEVDPFAPDMPIKYIDLHPFKRVPALVDGDFVLYGQRLLRDTSTRPSLARCYSRRIRVSVPEWRKSSRSSTPTDIRRWCGKSPGSVCLHPSEVGSLTKR